jgi:MiaB-like tRNA modifying enzyme
MKTKVAFITFGCSLNVSDSELMAGILKESGFDIVEDWNNAELVVINGCTVKHLAEKKFFKTVREVESKGKKAVIAGCVVQADKKYAQTIFRNNSIIGTKQLSRIAEVIEQTLEGSIIQLLGQEKKQRLNLPKLKRNKIIGIVPISEGCLGNCSYCKTRFARGTLHSYSEKAIIDEVKICVKEGCSEIWLTSQDCGAYGKDTGTNTILLLKAVLALKGDFFVRLGMMNPDFAILYIDELIGLYKKHKDKLFWFLHIPLQSGNNRILGLMRRRYTASDFIRVCEKIRKELPELTIATDVICGFPTETESEFRETVEVIKKVKPDVINISRFWARPGTEAAGMKGQIIGRESNKRSREMRKILKELSLERNKSWERWKGRIIIDEKGKIEGSFVGRNFAYKPVVVKGNFRLGQLVSVKVDRGFVYYLDGWQIVKKGYVKQKQIRASA